ncbi:MAG: hypothetical protein QXE79_04735 [Candidatus Bathyarchaeia archaeon]
MGIGFKPRDLVALTVMAVWAYTAVVVALNPWMKEAVEFFTKVMNPLAATILGYYFGRHGEIVEKALKRRF